MKVYSNYIIFRQDFECYRDIVRIFELERRDPRTSIDIRRMGPEHPSQIGRLSPLLAKIILTSKFLEIDLDEQVRGQHPVDSLR